MAQLYASEAVAWHALDEAGVLDRLAVGLVLYFVVETEKALGRRRRAKAAA